MNDVDARVEVLESSVRELDETLGVLISSMANQEQGEQKVKQRDVGDTVWECTGCAARLGIYNSKKYELRVRYKDFLIYIVPGVGGATSIPCRRCGHMNVIKDDGTGAPIQQE